MAEYDLPPGPRELFEATYRTIADYVGAKNIRLGGGTALAARWHHRHSTDIDLFVDAAPFREVADHSDEFETDIARGPLATDKLTIGNGFCTLLFAEGEVSISTTPAVTPEARSSDTVRGTEVVLDTNAEIIAKKIRGRMISNNELVPRDLYDIASARHHAPQALKTALGAINRDDRIDIVNELQALPTGWIERQPSKVLAPSRPEDVRLAVVITKRLIRASLELSPTKRDRGPDVGFDR